MLQASIRNALNRLLAIQCRSFPQYLMYARPYARGESQEILETIQQVVDDQQHMSERIVALLREADQTPNTGRFPMEFTDTHDLSIEHVVRECVAYQRNDINAIEQCLEGLKDSPSATAIGEEALGMAKGHLQLLEEAASERSDARTESSV